MMFRMDPYRDFDRLSQMLTQENGSLYAPVDAYRSGDDYVVEFDLPGVDVESIDVSVERNVLGVRAKRAANRSKAKEVVLGERFQGAFSRSIYLGSELDASRVKALYHDGVLEVTIPIADTAKARKVVVDRVGSTRTLEGAVK
ncbi:MAG: Hsp20/alpha crystallin family protein [Ferrimicrobium sp.]